MMTDTRNLVSATEVSRNAGRYITDAAHGRTVLVIKNNLPTAAIVSMETMDRISKLEELEDDLRLLSVAMIRSITDDGQRHSLDDVAREFGVDLDDLDEED